MNMIKTIAAAAALAATAFGAQAATPLETHDDLNSPYAIYGAGISFGSLSNLTGSVQFGVEPDIGFTLPATVAAYLVNWGAGSAAAHVANGTVSNAGPGAYSFSFGNLSAGSYNLWFSGTNTTGGTWISGGSYTVSAVPEPESYAMMLAGLGAIGFMARRRQRG